MRNIILLLILVISIFACENKKQIENPISNVNDLGLVPQVQKVELQKGAFVFSNATKLVDMPMPDSSGVLGLEMIDYIWNNLNSIKPIPPASQKENILVFQTISIDSLNNKEAYFLIIDSKRITIKAASQEGFFYGFQTLLQLFPDTIKSNEEYILPALSIEDWPEFAWRGAHLDVCRHFYSVEFVKKYIDLMSKHKLNTFHWHLTEDQGWRIEIKKYPKLTEIGSVRKETIVAKNFDPYIGDSIEYGGFYTQEQIKEIVKYADDRFITVVPEIEMPGHSLGALAAYPELSCTGNSFEVLTKWGVSDDIYCAGNDSVFVFLENVLDEVLELFPSKYIHIGGDEAPKTRWEHCSKCQSRIKTEGLKNEHELQSYFITRIEKYLNSKGRQIIGWDEILEGGLAPNASVMSWRGESGGIEAANQNHYVVMTPGKPCYFDHYQTEDKENEPLAIGGYNSLESVYLYNPMPEELPKDKQKYILGAQANVWTEYMPNAKHVEYMVYPRLCALSEVLWTASKQRDFMNFKQRMKKHYLRLDAWKVNYRKPKADD